MNDYLGLKEFIVKSLSDIVEGVSAAREKLGEAVVPEEQGVSTVAGNKVSPHQSVEFEVAVAVEKTSGSEARLGVLTSFIGAGVKGRSGTESTEHAKLRFSVPVYLRDPKQRPKKGTKKQQRMRIKGL